MTFHNTEKVVVDILSFIFVFFMCICKYFVAVTLSQAIKSATTLNILHLQSLLCTDFLSC